MSNLGLVMALGDRALSEGDVAAAAAADKAVAELRKVWAEDDAAQEEAAAFALDALTAVVRGWPIMRKHR